MPALRVAIPLPERREGVSSTVSFFESGARGEVFFTVYLPPGWTVEEGRIGSEALHQHLDTLGIPHEYEVLPGVTQAFSSLWHVVGSDGLVTGLYELPYHARASEEGE